MAARLDPDNVQPMRQSLHHLVAKAPWNDDALLERVRNYVLPALEKHGPVVSWIVDDTGFPKKGKHSVGVARQYCGQLGKQDNGQVGVSLSVATEESSLPIALRLFLPKAWAEDAQRRKQAHIPREIGLATKPDIALAQISQALDAGGAPGVVLADAGYGNGSEFRDALRSRSLTYAVGIQSTTTVYGALAAGAMERRQRASAQAIATHCRPCAAVRTRLGHGTGRPRLETGEVAARAQDRTGFS